MYHKEKTVIGPKLVTVELTGLGIECEPVDPVTSADPAVIAHHQAIDAARKKSAHKNRAVKPIWKESQMKAMRSGKTSRD